MTDFIPVCQRSADEEEKWWDEIAQCRDMTLEEFDLRCGVVPAPDPLSSVKSAVRQNGNGRHVDVEQV